nr:hypothetical protein [Halopseudomonas yangmingensis]
MKTRIRSKLAISLLTAGSLLLAGCATTGGSQSSNSVSADPRLTQGHDAKFFSQSGFQACAAAAGVGMLACALSESSNKQQCMILVGLTACGVAMGANYYLDQRRSEYANTTERLQIMTADIRQDTDRVIARSETMQMVISDDQQRLAQIQQDMQNQTLDIDAASREIAAIDKNIATMRRDISNMQAKANEYQRVAEQERNDGAGDQVQLLDQEIARMNQRVAALQQEVDGLYNQRSAITLG